MGAKQIKTVGELIDFLSAFDRDAIVSAEYAQMIGSMVIDYKVRPLFDDFIQINGEKEYLIKHLEY